MSKPILTAILLLLPFPVAAQEIDKSIQAQIETYLNLQVEPPFQVQMSPKAPVALPDSVKANLRFGFQKRMALSGHGILFDIEGNRVTLSDGEALELQSELLKAVRADDALAKDLPENAGEGLAKLADEIASRAEAENDPQRRAILSHLEIRTRAWRLTDPERSDYLWRADYLLDKHLVKDQISIFRDFDVLIRDFGRWIDIILGRTTYMGDCDRAGVPVPPDFSTAGSQWTHQGNLTTNMLSPGAAAQVWTWAHPSRRGVCVALPRGTGAPGNGLAGIICQGSATGNACFWDNIDRTTGARIPWAGATLQINQLQDGSMLAENCTACHKGNNVYLVAPDDPTWCKLMRGNRGGAGCAAPSGPDAVNITLEVEGVVNPLNQPGFSLFHSRYNPMSGVPARPAWVNSATTSSTCGGMCHLDSIGSFTLPPMPPGCGTRCN